MLQEDIASILSLVESSGYQGGVPVVAVHNCSNCSENAVDFINPCVVWSVAHPEDCCMLSILPRRAFLCQQFWHGVIPTSYFRFFTRVH